MLGKIEMIMNQSIYDVWVMKFCEEKLSTGNEYVDLDVLNYYCSSMKGEYSDAMDCGIEFPSVCNLILEKYSDIGPLLLVYLGRSIDIRMQLNDDMEPKSGIRKVFGGKFFSKSPNSAFERRSNAYKNIASLIDFQISKRNS
jgi:hypothetical protein